MWMSQSLTRDKNASKSPELSVIFWKVLLLRRLAPWWPLPCHLSQSASTRYLACNDNNMLYHIFTLFQIKEVPREVSKGVEMFREVCDQKPRMVPKVECETRMQEIELKEICLDIDFQLPREECRKEEREECKFEPKEVIVQKCEATVKEVCQAGTENVCEDKCKYCILALCAYMYIK